MRNEPMWRCAECGREFANRNQSHACGRHDLESPRFRRIETFSPRNHLHTFRLMSEREIDDEFRAWMAEAYRVGNQEHLVDRKR